MFDKVIVAIGHNPDKPDNQYSAYGDIMGSGVLGYGTNNGCIELVLFTGLLADYVSDINKNERIISAVIRGLRNSKDFEDEKIQQYHNEDLKIGIPTFYVIASRSLVHISSSAIRTIDKVRGK